MIEAVFKKNYCQLEVQRSFLTLGTRILKISPQCPDSRVVVLEL